MEKLDRSKSVVVRASTPEKWGVTRSKLSDLDLLMPPYHVWCTMFYKDSVPPQKVEKALARNLNRYGELAGRLVLVPGESYPMVEMNNMGAQVTYLPESPVTLKELEGKQFENDFVHNNFCEDDQEQEEPGQEAKQQAYLLKIRLQRLFGGGLMMSLGFHYQICDVNSMYVFVADLCSLIRRGIYAFKEDQVVTCKRTEVFKPNSDPIVPHPELEVLSPDQDNLEEKWAPLIKDSQNYPRVNVRFQISKENMEKLKTEVCSKHPNEVPVSSNDVIASLFWRACVNGNKRFDGKQTSVFQLTCNGRFRRKKPLPRPYFGNAMFVVYTSVTKDKLVRDSIYRTACRVRKQVIKINDAYMQSVVNFVAQEGADNVVFSSGHHPLDFSMANWNQYFDWYKDADLGKGKPLKFLIASKHLAGMAIVLPGNPDGVEILTGLDEEQFKGVLSDYFIDKYFTWC